MLKRPTTTGFIFQCIYLTRQIWQRLGSVVIVTVYIHADGSSRGGSTAIRVDPGTIRAHLYTVLQTSGMSGSPVRPWEVLTVQPAEGVFILWVWEANPRTLAFRQVAVVVTSWEWDEVKALDRDGGGFILFLIAKLYVPSHLLA